MADKGKVEKYQSNLQSVRVVLQEQSNTLTTQLASPLETRQSNAVTMQNLEGLQSNAETIQNVQASQAGEGQKQPQAKK